MTDVILSLGTNLGDRKQNMREMLRCVGEFLGNMVTSDIMETEPLGMPGATMWFLNCIVRGLYDGSPEQLLNDCRAVEQALGRVRGEEILPRTADVDILLYGNAVLANTNLTVPHPRMLERRFCLEGLRQVAPEAGHPKAGKSFETLHHEMDDLLSEQQVRAFAGELQPEDD